MVYIPALLELTCRVFDIYAMCDTMKSGITFQVYYTYSPWRTTPIPWIFEVLNDVLEECLLNFNPKLRTFMSVTFLTSYTLM